MGILKHIVLNVVIYRTTFNLGSWLFQGYIATHPRPTSPSTRAHFDYCVSRARFHIPVAMYLSLSLMNLLIVVNSSVNFIIYCVVENSFRDDLFRMVKNIFVFALIPFTRRGGRGGGGGRETAAAAEGSAAAAAAAGVAEANESSNYGLWRTIRIIWKILRCLLQIQYWLST